MTIVDLKSPPHKMFSVRLVMRLAEGRCPFHGPSFALTSEYIENITYEEIFYLMKEGNFSFTEAYNLPIGLRTWFVKRLIKYMYPEEEK